ncbi:hypothetical protein [Aquabacterium sp. J223]|uniref:hypothetical protein n=1 Tax=Aquabacterium sp. J223 TaxID=2898431 RepID=UPI0021ADF3EF|nr:hypothetical protein [Aquabacterium sp. J223]UUX94825.1 hypothetical protein LRS07_16295 [Aquabacterium sp. J223]
MLQLARQPVEEQQVLVGREVEALVRAAAAEQQRLQLGHRVERLRPDRLQPRQHRRVVGQLALHRLGIGPARRVGIEALLEALARALVGHLVVEPAVDLHQLEVGHGSGAPGAAQLGQQQVDGRVVLAEHEEEVGLLLEVDVLLDAQAAPGLGRHRRAHRQQRSRRRAGRHGRRRGHPHGRRGGRCHQGAGRGDDGRRGVGRRLAGRTGAVCRRRCSVRVGGVRRFGLPPARVLLLAPQAQGQQRAGQGKRRHQQPWPPKRLLLARPRLPQRGQLVALRGGIGLQLRQALLHRAQPLGRGRCGRFRGTRLLLRGQQRGGLLLCRQQRGGRRRRGGRRGGGLQLQAVATRRRRRGARGGGAATGRRRIALAGDQSPRRRRRHGAARGAGGRRCRGRRRRGPTLRGRRGGGSVQRPPLRVDRRRARRDGRRRHRRRVDQRDQAALQPHRTTDAEGDVHHRLFHRHRGDDTCHRLLAIGPGLDRHLDLLRREAGLAGNDLGRHALRVQRFAVEVDRHPKPQRLTQQRGHADGAEPQGARIAGADDEGQAEQDGR